MLVTYDDRLTRHLAGVRHPERPERVSVVAAALEAAGMLGERVPVRAASEAELQLAHPATYIERVKRECARLSADSAAMLSTGDTAIDAGSYEAACYAAGGALEALDTVVATGRAAFALVRPPGHHAEPARGMGFCLFNNAAVAARAYTARMGRPALIADIDYHHGNGTQALVGDGMSYLSTHADPAYPGTGDPCDNRVRSEGSLLNIPVPVSGIATEAFVAIWARTLRSFAERTRPGLLVVSAGYDFVSGDPVGDLGVDVSAARQLGRIVRDVAREFCDGRVLFVLEGGYDPDALAHCVVETIAGYEEVTAAEPASERAIPVAQRAIIDAAEAEA